MKVQHNGVDIEIKKIRNKSHVSRGARLLKDTFELFLTGLELEDPDILRRVNNHLNKLYRFFRYNGEIYSLYIYEDLYS